MNQNPIWQCTGGPKVAMTAKLISAILDFIIFVFIVFALVLGVTDGEELTTVFVIIIAAVLACYDVVTILEYMTMRNSYIRIYNDHIEMLSTSHDEVMKQSWTGAKVTINLAQIKNVSVIGKKLGVQTAEKQYEAWTPDADAAAKRLSAVMSNAR